MPVGRCVMRTAESAVLTPWPPGPEARKTSTRISSSRAFTPAEVHPEEHLRPVLGLRTARARVDREDRRLDVVRPRHHDFQLELVEVLAEARDAGGDLGVEASVVRLCRQLEEHAEVLGARRQLLQPTDAPAELRALADELLSAAVVLPEGRRRHLPFERGEPRSEERRVGKGWSARRAACE